MLSSISRAIFRDNFLGTIFLSYKKLYKTRTQITVMAATNMSDSGPQETTTTTTAEATTKGVHPANEVVEKADGGNPSSKDDAAPLATASDDAKCCTMWKTVTEFPHYKAAQALLQAGEMDTTLQTIEEGLELITEQLHAEQQGKSDSKPAAESGNSDGSTDNASPLELHPALIPLNYMYGTTLLYVIEEGNDDNGLTAAPPALTTDPSVATMPGTAVSQQAEGENPPLTVADAATTTEEVTDLQIAWENLDLARTVLLGQLERDGVESSVEHLLIHRLLASVFLRQGDLLRHNSKHQAAIDSYTNCLQFVDSSSTMVISNDCQEQQQKLDSFLPKWSHRKIAELQYNIGLSNIMLCTAAAASSDNTTQPDVAAPEGQQPQSSAKSLTEVEKTKLRDTGRESFWKAAVYMMKHVGMMLKMEDTVSKFIDEATSWTSADVSQKPDKDIRDGNTKTTGMSPQDIDKCHKKAENTDDERKSQLLSQRMQFLRVTLQEWLDPQRDTLAKAGVDLATIYDLLSVLHETEETVAELGTGEQAIQDVMEMKQDITEATAAAASSTAEGGFDAPSKSTAAAAPINTSMMVVKKKKKKAPASSNAEPDPKRSKPASSE